jgi:hypothetical protein
MIWENKLQAFCHHFFMGITLLGCVVPWVTPRYFPVHSIPGQNRAFSRLELETTDSAISQVGGEQLEVVQTAC